MMREKDPPSQMPIQPGMTSMPDVTASLVDRALSQFRVEVAGDLGLPARPPSSNKYMGHITAREAGHLGGPIGGEMVRRMIEGAEKDMVKKDPPLL